MSGQVILTIVLRIGIKSIHQMQLFLLILDNQGRMRLWKNL